MVTELNAGQHPLECLIFTQKEYVSELFNQERIDIAITKLVITHFRVFRHSKSCCLAFCSTKRVEIHSFTLRALLILQHAT